MIRFRMFRITVPQFAILEDELIGSGVTYETKFQLKYSLESKSIGVSLYLSSFSEEKKRLAVLEVFCEFSIHPDDWKSCKDNGVLRISKDDIPAFIAQTIGVARGIYHCRTEGTYLNGYVLPPINAVEMVKEDLIINL